MLEAVVTFCDHVYRETAEYPAEVRLPMGPYLKLLDALPVPAYECAPNGVLNAKCVELACGTRVRVADKETR